MLAVVRYLARVSFPALVVALLGGCDPVTRHKALSTVFDGVPSLPAPQELCAEYAEQRLAAYKDELNQKAVLASQQGKEESKHPPYAERKCDDCHDKTKENGLVAPKEKFCFVCHGSFIKGENVHGPVAVGECLSCHEPHTSDYRSLLKSSRGSLCGVCHKEKRLAQGMHDRARLREMVCLDCHDPHFSNGPFLLK
jgi:predicted CXXCH cytochrome family protein